MPWVSDYNGEVYADDDRRLRGMGNPPADPAWVADHPGQGTHAKLRFDVAPANGATTRG